MYLCGYYKIIEHKLYFSLFTRAANNSVIDIHDRMPVIITEPDVRAYLTDSEKAQHLLAFSSLFLLRSVLVSK